MKALRVILCGVFVPVMLIVLYGTKPTTEPIRIEHERGSLELPAPAKRVATLNWAFADLLP